MHVTPPKCVNSAQVTMFLCFQMNKRFDVFSEELANVVTNGMNLVD